MPWYFSWWLIILLGVFSVATYGITFVAAIVLIYLRNKKKKDIKVKEIIIETDSVKAELERAKEALENTKTELNEIQSKLSEGEEVFKKNEEEYVAQLKDQYEEQGKTIVQNILKEAEDKVAGLQKYAEERDELVQANEKMAKTLKTNERKLLKLKTEFNGIQNLISIFPQLFNERGLEPAISDLLKNYDKESLLKNLVDLEYHAMNSKELRKEITRVKKEIQKLLEAYEGRYTTKANKTIYQLMVIGLQSELQNILYTLSYAKHDEAIGNAKDLIRKYLSITAEGNASIAPTIARFLSELEPLFIDAINIEYEYYTKREQEKEEQRLIREQMRQDAAERKELEAQRKKLEAEESKFEVELQRTMELLENEADPEKKEKIEARIFELEEQQHKIAEEKEEILKRANGKAGYVYIISNLGSFGDQVFKIGMTRRLNPQDRIDELGDASVPFKFDVHAMVFSDDAVSLENRLHQELAAKRLNKVNLRKEFFVTDIDELQNLVEELDSTVEFRKTLMAQEYYRSLELTEEFNQVPLET